jgi:hypothetical protein
MRGFLIDPIDLEELRKRKGRRDAAAIVKGYPCVIDFYKTEIWSDEGGSQSTKAEEKRVVT